MKRFFFITIQLLLFVPISFSQFTEFKTHENGLIYNERTMHQLEQIVDSLNLKFKSCSLDEIRYGLPQAKAHFIVSDTNASAIEKDLDKQLPFDELIAKYPELTVEKNQLVKRSNTNDQALTFSATQLNLDYIFNARKLYIDASDKIKIYSSDKMKSRYVYYRRLNVIQAYYFLEDFSSRPLPLKYNELFQYVDCMVDTAHSIYFKGAGYDYYFNEDSDNKYYTIATNILNQSTKDSSELQSNAAFIKALEKAYELALETKKSNMILEHWVCKYLSPKKALNLKRSRKVMGACSRDDSPRKHARDIAMLSAESIEWEIFLRAHLDIMNDRFARASDASYAWRARKTYIKEIEELGINVPNLLIGACLSVSNPSLNHYFANIGRIGRAISESQNIQEIEKLLLDAIQDKELDLYNRINMHFIYRIYCLYLDDENVKNNKLDVLQNVLTTFPPEIAEQIKLKE